MIVDSVKYHGVKTTKTHSQDLLNITISPAISIGTLDSVTVYYHGSPDYSGFGSLLPQLMDLAMRLYYGHFQNHTEPLNGGPAKMTLAIK